MAEEIAASISSNPVPREEGLCNGDDDGEDKAARPSTKAKCCVEASLDISMPYVHSAVSAFLSPPKYTNDSFSLRILLVRKRLQSSESTKKKKKKI